MEDEEKPKVTVSMTRGMYDKLEELRKKKEKMSIPELIREVMWRYVEEEERRGKKR